MKPILTTLLVLLTGNVCCGEDVVHGFLATGSHTYIMDGSGKQIWNYPHGTRDGYVLPNGNVILTLNKGQQYSGGAVIEVDRRTNTETLIWKGTQSEVNSAHPTQDGTFVITEAGPFTPE